MPVCITKTNKFQDLKCKVLRLVKLEAKVLPLKDTKIETSNSKKKPYIRPLYRVEMSNFPRANIFKVIFIFQSSKPSVSLVSQSSVFAGSSFSRSSIFQHPMIHDLVFILHMSGDIYHGTMDKALVSRA